MKRFIPKVALGGQSLRFSLALCAIFISAFLQAGELSEQDVRAAVETWVRHVTADARPEAFIVKMEPHVVDGKTVAYIAHLFREGFCLCGADNLVLPVYLYNPGGIYDPENPDCQYILWEIATRTKKLTEAIREGEPEAQQYQEALSDRAELWQNLISGIAPERIEKERNLLIEPDSMSLSLTAQWDQISPYNDQCPELTPGADEHTLVGCIATAMSQIMYYWKWPNSGVGTGSTVYYYRWRTNWDQEPLTNDPGIPPEKWGGRLEWIATAGGRLRMNGYWDYSLYYAAREINDDPDYLSALENLWNRMTPASTNCWVNFGAANYNWSIIADIHTDPPDPGDAEVAELCYHAGVSVAMGYGIWGSGSSTPLVANALEDHFHYDPDAVGEDRNISTMTEEILWLRPLEISGCIADNIGCHAWVVYGYNKATDPDRQFLMNMGWGPGSSHVWYSCDNIFPFDQYHVTRIAPEDVVKFVGNNSSGNGSPGNPYKGIEEAVVLAPDDATLIFKAGSINTFSAGTLVINRPLTLKGVDVVIQKQ